MEHSCIWSLTLSIALRHTNTLQTPLKPLLNSHRSITDLFFAFVCKVNFITSCSVKFQEGLRHAHRPLDSCFANAKTRNMWDTLTKQKNIVCLRLCLTHNFFIISFRETEMKGWHKCKERHMKSYWDVTLNRGWKVKDDESVIINWPLSSFFDDRLWLKYFVDWIISLMNNSSVL